MSIAIFLIVVSCMVIQGCAIWICMTLAQYMHIIGKKKMVRVVEGKDTYVALEVEINNFLYKDNVGTAYAGNQKNYNSIPPKYNLVDIRYATTCIEGQFYYSAVIIYTA